MKEIISSNWNQDYGNKDKISVLNKTSNFNVIPIDQNYMFFKNGAYRSEEIDPKILPKDIKKILENEYRNSQMARYGPGSIRPLPLNESEMCELYYINSPAKASLSTFTLGSVSPLAVAEFFFAGKDLLLVLIAAMAITNQINNTLSSTYNSAGSCTIPKIGKSKMFFNKKIKPEKDSILSSVNRNYPIIKDEEVYKKNITNLSDDKVFKSTIGSKYDTLMSAAELNGGSAFATTPFNQLKKKDAFIENIEKNSQKKYELMKSFVKDPDIYKKSETDSNNILLEFFRKILEIVFPISVFVDFTDYTIAKQAISSPIRVGDTNYVGGVSVSTKTPRKYKNPEKEKSVFGPYICRSKYSYWYYPTIVLTGRGGVSSPPVGSSFEQMIGGVNFFNKGTVPIYGSQMDFIISVLLTMSGLPIAPFASGGLNTINKQLFAPSSFPKNFPKNKK